IDPSPERGWYTKCIASAVLPIPLPAVLTVTVPFENVAFPCGYIVPGRPISRSSHPEGNGCEVTVNQKGLLAFWLGDTDTPKWPVVAPVGIAAMIEVALHVLIVIGASFK